MVSEFLQKLKIQQERQIILKRANVILFYVFLACAIFLPADPFELKIISLFCLFALNVKTIFSPKTKFDLVILLLGLVIPTATIVVSIFLTGNIVENIKMGYAGYVLLLILVIRKYDIDYIKIFSQIILGLAFLTIFIGALDILGIMDLYDNPIAIFLTNTDCAMIGRGSALPIGFMVFMKASPLFVVAIPLALKEKKYFSFAILFIATMLSGTRANIFVGLAVTALCVLLSIKNKQIIKTLIICAIGALIILILDGRVLNAIIDMFVRKESSDAIRTGILDSILAGFTKDPLSFFVGSGYSSTFFNPERGEFTAVAELSYFNLLRQVGLIFFLFIMLAYLLPVFVMCLKRKNYTVIIGYIGYMVIAYTNPLLYSTTGLVAMLVMYFLMIKALRDKSLDFEQIKETDKK